MAWVTPPILAVGDVLGASDWNTIAGDLSFLYGDTSWTAVTSFQNSWVSVGSPYAPVGYRLVGTRVWFRGRLQSGTSGDTAFVLPTGYLPAYAMVIGAYGSGGDTASGLNVQTSGDVAPYMAGTAVGLDGCSFDTLT